MVYSVRRLQFTIYRLRIGVPQRHKKGHILWRDVLAEVSFGEWLRRQRKAAGLTQEQLALQISCSTSALKKIEAEERRPSAPIVERLAEIFNIPSSEHISFLRFARGDWKSVPTLQSGDAPWRVPIPVSPTNLPISLTSFIGREKEVEEIICLINKNRLVTLTGPGGVGKTRLAIQSSNKLLSQFKDGICWVELAPLTDEALVPQALAKSLGVREIPNQSWNQTLSNFLRSRQLLLVLDNCEHLIAGCAHLADTLLGLCPNLKILATSRESLGLLSEDVWSVPILSLPNPQRMTLIDLLMQFEGIRLFVERASAAKSDFILTERNALSVAHKRRRWRGLLHEEHSRVLGAAEPTFAAHVDPGRRGRERSAPRRPRGARIHGVRAHGEPS